MKKISTVLLLLLSLVVFSHPALYAQHEQHGGIQEVRVGAVEFFSKYAFSAKGMRVGVICNRTSVMPDGRRLVDKMVESDINVTAIFTPEHGMEGKVAAGGSVEQSTDPTLGIPIYSLYGKTNKPTKEMLDGVDALVFDIQDVGARFYTYISTMALAMKAADENRKRFIVLDRPNPINGIDVEGPMLDSAQTSFIGMFPMPIRHGLTIGEIARMICYKWWNLGGLDLHIIPMQGWRRTDWLNDITVHWTAPSPNMKTLQTATVYPGTCLFEGTNVSEGRGTDKPFEYIGAPWIDEKAFAAKLNTLNLPGIQFEPIRFTPKVDSVASPNPKFKGQECGGVFLKVTDRSVLQSVNITGMMLTTLHSMYPDSLTFIDKQFDLLAGTTTFRTSILSGNGIDWKQYNDAVEQFKKDRVEFFIY